MKLCGGKVICTKTDALLGYQCGYLFESAYVTVRWDVVVADDQREVLSFSDLLAGSCVFYCLSFLYA